MEAKLSAVLLLTVLLAGPCMSATISLFNHAGHNGHVGDVDVNGCHTLPAWQNNLVSSVNTHGRCFVLYEHGSCNGARVKVGNGVGDCPDHGRLSSCNFNDRATSISQC